MTTEYPILCKACRRWNGDDSCKSFAVIPDEIIRYGADHRHSRAGELPFELDESKQAEFDDWLTYSPQLPRG